MGIKTCKDCMLFERSETFNFCLAKDLYTEANDYDDICDDFIESKKK